MTKAPRSRTWRRRLVRVSPETWVALAISAGALVLTIYQASLARQQARLEVLPRLQIEMASGDNVSMSVSNKGLGPATIKSFLVKVDDSVVSTWDTVLRRLKAVPEDTIAIQLSALYPEQLIPAGVATSLVSLARYPGGSRLQKQIHRLQVEICYCSLYEECWVASLRARLDANDKRECRRDSTFFSLGNRDTVEFRDTVFVRDTVFIVGDSVRS